MGAATDAAAAQAGAIALLWDRPATPRRGPKPALNLEAIAEAGIGVADADGLAAVTMQRVAAALGVTKMALYRYVPGKAELVALMIDMGLGEAPQFPSAGRVVRAGATLLLDFSAAAIDPLRQCRAHVYLVFGGGPGGRSGAGALAGGDRQGPRGILQDVAKRLLERRRERFEIGPAQNPAVFGRRHGFQHDSARIGPCGHAAGQKTGETYIGG